MSNFLAWQMHNVAPDGLAWQACHRSGLPLVDLLTWHPLQCHSVAGWDIGVVRAPLSLSPCSSSSSGCTSISHFLRPHPLKTSTQIKGRRKGDLSYKVCALVLLSYIEIFAYVVSRFHGTRL